MLASYATGVIGIVVVLLAWLGIQSAWSSVFPDASADPDALAGRMGCHGCDPTEKCDRRGSGLCAATEEEIR